MSLYADVRELLTEVRIFAGIAEFDALEPRVLSILAQAKRLEEEVLAEGKEVEALRRSLATAEQATLDADAANVRVRRGGKRDAYKHALSMIDDPEMIPDTCTRQVAASALQSALDGLDAEAFDERG